MARLRGARGTISIGGTTIPIRSWKAAYRREEVFYAPLDGSRIDYHPCGRPEDHPRYIDPATGFIATPMDAYHVARIEDLYFSPTVQCGRCAARFTGVTAHGLYIRHRCDPGGPIESFEDWAGGRLREGRDY